MTKLKMHLLILLLVSAAVWTAAAQEATPSDAAPPRDLVVQADVPAPIHAVWQALTTSDGLSTWLSPEAVGDLRPGGEWTAHFPGGSTGGGTIAIFLSHD